MADTIGYDELKALQEMNRPNFGQAIGEAGRALGYGMQGKAMQYKPLVEPDNSARELMKGIILAKIKNKMEMEQQANDPLRQADIKLRNAQADLYSGKSGAIVNPAELAAQKQQAAIELENVKGALRQELERQRRAVTPQEQEEIQANINNLNAKTQEIESSLQNQNPQIPEGLVPTGGRFDKFGRFMPSYGISPERRTEARTQGKAEQDYNAYQSDANQALLAVDKIEREAKNLGDFQRGVVPQTIAKIGTGIGKYAKNQDITRYLGVVSQELIPAARKIMEEKGPITEFDVARVEKGLGELTTPIEDKVFLLNELRTKIRKALELKRNIAGGGGINNGTQMSSPGGNTQEQYQIGQTISKNGKTYRYIGNGQWEY